MTSSVQHQQIRASSRSARPQPAGPTLLHTAREAMALAGDVVTFKAIVFNEAQVPLHNVRFIPVSLTNANLDALTYLNPPLAAELQVGTLLPGTFASLTLDYEVSVVDVSTGGPLISAMAVAAELSGPAGAIPVQDEWDAVVQTAGKASLGTA
jgi:hypothetical protein